MNAPDRIFATAPADPAAVLRRYYRGHARLYDATRWSFLFGRAALIRALARVSPPPRHILEIGCGTGSNLVRLVRGTPIMIDGDSGIAIAPHRWSTVAENWDLLRVVDDVLREVPAIDLVMEAGKGKKVSARDLELALPRLERWLHSSVND